MSSIEQIPKAGGAWADYVRELGSLADWDPAPYTAVGEDLRVAIDDRNDPGAWLAFAGTAARAAWQSLPEDLREQLRDLVENLVLDGLSNIGAAVGQAGAAAVGSVGEILPVIGAVIQPLIDFVVSVVKTAKAMEDIREYEAATHRQWRRYQTLQQLGDPAQWVFSVTQVRNYTARAGKEWRRRPCLRSGYGADRIFTGKLGAPDVGSCDKGVLYSCPAIYRSNDYEDCTPKYPEDAGKECVRVAGFSALFWPFWSPSYAPEPMQLVTKHADPNALLLTRQIALLSNPSINLRVPGQHVLDVATTFVNWYFRQLEIYAPPGQRFGLLKINNEGFAPGTQVADRLTIDARKIPDFVPTGPERNKFYFDDAGLIRAYDYAGVDPADWGVRAAGGGAPQNLAISVAQYNAVVGNTLAFFTARANFLRSGSVMSALVREFGTPSFAPDVRAAMDYSAAYGSMLPPVSTIARGPGLGGMLTGAPGGPGPGGPGLGGTLTGVPAGPGPGVPDATRGLSRGQAAAIAGAVALLAAWRGPELVAAIYQRLRERR
jgi:hypothetical protein